MGAQPARPAPSVTRRRVAVRPPASSGGQPGDRAGRRQGVQEQQPGERPGQHHRGVAQLGVGRPGHHLPQAGQPRVRAHADDLPGQARASVRPRWPLIRRPRATSSMRAPRIGARPPALSRALAADQHAAAGRRGRPRAGHVHPPERVELGEEVDEGGDHDALPAGGRAQQGHLRDQVPVVALGRGHQAAQRVRLPGDVGVGEHHVIGPDRPRAGPGPWPTPCPPSARRPAAGRRRSPAAAGPAPAAIRAATSPVPSELPSSTTMTVSAPG